MTSQSLTERFPWKPWTPEDDAQLAKLFPTPDAEISKIIGRGKDAVRQRRNTLGLRHRPSPKRRDQPDNDNWQQDAVKASKELVAALAAYGGAR